MTARLDRVNIIGTRFDNADLSERQHPAAHERHLVRGQPSRSREF